MKNKNIVRYGVIGAIVLIMLYLVTLIGDDTRSYTQVDTSVALKQLSEDNVKEAQIDDREQRIRLTLKKPIKYEEREGVEEVMAQYPARSTDAVFKAVQDSKTESYTCLLYTSPSPRDS